MKTTVRNGVNTNLSKGNLDFGRSSHVFRSFRASSRVVSCSMANCLNVAVLVEGAQPHATIQVQLGIFGGWQPFSNSGLE